MKIILSGTSSIGKSTLFDNVINNCQNTVWKFRSEIARDLLEKGEIDSVGMTCSHKDTMKIFEEHYKHILTDNYLVSDRGALDAFVYATQNYLDGAYTYEQHKEHEEIFLRCIKHYDKIFYIPLKTQGLVLDGARDSSQEYRFQIDSMFRKIISMYNLESKLVRITDDSEEGLKKELLNLVL